LIAAHGSVGGNGYAIEYAGEAVQALDIEARLTLCNMATEFSAVTGFIAPDEKTFAYLRGRHYAPGADLWPQAEADWRLLVSDEGAQFDREIVIDVSTLAPMVTWGTSPQHAVPITDAVPSQEHSAPIVDSPICGGRLSCCADGRLPRVSKRFAYPVLWRSSAPPRLKDCTGYSLRQDLNGGQRVAQCVFSLEAKALACASG
jgi:homoaconitase/3-isopropylmalate dehydratase large subunit